jgi:hypothetical protein
MDPSVMIFEKSWRLFSISPNVLILFKDLPVLHDAPHEIPDPMGCQHWFTAVNPAFLFKPRRYVRAESRTGRL